MDQNDEDHFRRIHLVQQVDRARELVEHYFDGIHFYIDQIEKDSREIGMLNERLGG
ncbi:hypothetical protein [Phytoactinopolyspora halotolerans]|uniref:Uncharacterized protein n=1 Tax=Phytoactinopolyspora halotolerans TaxID=1981512 RepID=A0A6L9S6J7_9ACTN|nr:hypothetical protein [Phytoactinopolyspora halotolerans]NEE00158.1 hypothetical protein [Phytoactinopolyspora halotolerans]